MSGKTEWVTGATRCLLRQRQTVRWDYRAIYTDGRSHHFPVLLSKGRSDRLGGVSWLEQVSSWHRLPMTKHWELANIFRRHLCIKGWRKYLVKREAVQVFVRGKKENRCCNVSVTASQTQQSNLWEHKVRGTGNAQITVAEGIQLHTDVQLLVSLRALTS